MSVNQHICEKMQIVPGVIPVNLATGAQTGDWVSMSKYGRCAIVLLAGVGAASQDVTITIEQAATNGGSAKALNFTRVDTKQASALTAVGQFTQNSQSAGNTYTSDTSGETQKLWVIDIKAEDLDVANGYSWLRASLNDPGTNSQIGTILYLLHEPRYSDPPLPAAIS